MDAVSDAGRNLASMTPDVQDNGKYGCPNGFNNLTVAWYINEPLEGHEPNVECIGEYDFFAARDIEVGEELTVDYSTYNEIP